MTGYFVTLFVLLGIAVAAFLVLSGWGIALLLWPIDVRPMFPANASLTEIYGMDVATCDFLAFHERQDALRVQAKTSLLATLNVARLNKAFMKAMGVILPRLSAATATARTTHLEAYADQWKVKLSWRQVLFLSEQTPTRKELQDAYAKAISDVNASAKATAQVEIAMSQAMIELGFQS